MEESKGGGPGVRRRGTGKEERGGAHEEQRSQGGGRFRFG